MSDEKKNSFLNDLLENVTKEIGNLGKEVTDRLNNRTSSNANSGSTIPAVNISENGESFEVEVAAPGMAKELFALSIENGALTISSEGLPPSQKRYKMHEFYYGAFKRTFSVPETIEISQISATYKDGILLIILPKKAEFKQPDNKNIQIW